MDSQFFSSTVKTTVSLVLMGLAGLSTTPAMAQEDVPTTEGQVQQLEEVIIPKGTIQQLEGVEARTVSESPWAVGGDFNNDSEIDPAYLDLDYEAKYSIFGLEVRVNPHSEDWVHLNHGDGTRGYSEIVLVRF